MNEQPPSNLEWKLVCELSSRVQAELVRSLLESQGIQVLLSQEGAGRAYGLTVGALGLIEVLVPFPQFDAAQDLVNEYFQESDLEA